MEEEKGNYLYILFIVLGVALMAVGAFYYLTDENIELVELDREDSDENKNGKIVTSEDIKSVDFSDSATIQLDGSDLTVSVTSVESSYSLNINDKSIGTLANKDGFELFTILDRFLLIKINLDNTFSHFYIIDSTGTTVKDIYDLTNGTYAVEFADDKLQSSRFIESEKVVVFRNKKIDACDDKELSKYDLSGGTVIKSSYNLVIYDNGKFGLELVKGSETSLIETQTTLCQ